MEPFLAKFFPDVYYHVTGHDEGSNAYCKYNNQGLQLFTSCLFIAGMIGGIIGGYTTRSSGLTISLSGDIMLANREGG